MGTLVHMEKAIGGGDALRDEMVKDFLIESNENLDRLGQELVKLESSPSCEELWPVFSVRSTPSRAVADFWVLPGLKS